MLTLRVRKCQFVRAIENNNNITACPGLFCFILVGLEDAILKQLLHIFLILNFIKKSNASLNQPMLNISIAYLL